MRAGEIIRLTAAFLCMLTLTGCNLQDTIDEIRGGKSWEPGETNLTVRKDGTLTETVIDALDQSYYDSGELEQMIHSTVSQYNQTHGADAVTVDALSLENHQVVLTMTYQSAEDYADYNNVRFYNGSMLGAEMEGYLFYNQFRKVEDGTVSGELITNEEPLKHKEYQVLVTDNSHLVQVPGDVVYVSANASPMAKRQVRPAGEETSPQTEGLVLPSSAVYVEEKDGPVSAKDLEKNYLYIIYEF